MRAPFQPSPAFGLPGPAGPGCSLAGPSRGPATGAPATGRETKPAREGPPQPGFHGWQPGGCRRPNRARSWTRRFGDVVDGRGPARDALGGPIPAPPPGEARVYTKPAGFALPISFRAGAPGPAGPLHGGPGRLASPGNNVQAVSGEAWRFSFRRPPGATQGSIVELLLGRATKLVPAAGPTSPRPPGRRILEFTLGQPKSGEHHRGRTAPGGPIVLTSDQPITPGPVGPAPVAAGLIRFGLIGPTVLPPSPLSPQGPSGGRRGIVLAARPRFRCWTKTNSDWLDC